MFSAYLASSFDLHLNMGRVFTISRILLLFLICGCDGGYFAHRNHTRRNFYNHFKSQSDRKMETTVLPVSSESTTSNISNMLDVTTAAVTTTSPTTPDRVQTTSDNGILLLPDDFRPPGLHDATSKQDSDADKNAIDATGSDYMDLILSSEDDAADIMENATGDEKEDDTADGLTVGSRPGLFNWQRGMTASLSIPRLGNIGQGTRAVSFRRPGPGQRAKQRRQRTRTGLPGVKYMVYTGELNNKNLAKNGN